MDHRGGLYRAELAESEKKLLSIRAEMEEQYAELCAFWERYRGGIPREYLDSEHKGVMAAMDRLI